MGKIWNSWSWWESQRPKCWRCTLKNIKKTKPSKKRSSEASSPASSLVPKALGFGWTREDIGEDSVTVGRWKPIKSLKRPGNDSSAQNNINTKRNHWFVYQTRDGPALGTWALWASLWHLWQSFSSMFSLRPGTEPQVCHFRKAGLTLQKAESFCCWHQGPRNGPCLAGLGHVLISDAIRKVEEETQGSEVVVLGKDKRCPP